MERVELLAVLDRFQVAGVGLVLAPDFFVPEVGWKNLTESVLIVTPQACELEVKAHFNLIHLNITDPTIPHDHRWRVIVALADVQKEQVPLGSRVFASFQTRNVLSAKHEG
jgi:hypothetical protein